MDTTTPRRGRTTTFRTAGSLLASLGLVALMLGSATVALADNNATVTSHQAFSSGANNVSYWCAGGTKTDFSDPGVPSFVLTADYAKVIVKAGAGQYANTIFDNPASGQSVWADTNGNNVFDPSGQTGDKGISHIIFCPTAAVITPTEVTVTWQLPAGPWAGNGTYWQSGFHRTSYPGPVDQSTTFPQAFLGEGVVTPPCGQWAQVDYYKIASDSDQALLTSLIGGATLTWNNGPADAAIYSSSQGYGFMFLYGGDCSTPPVHLTLTKSVVNTGGGTADKTDWTLSATGATTISGATGDDAITGASVTAGTYTLAESGGPSGYTPSAWSCDGGTLTGSSLVLAAGGSASCSITNTYVPGPSVTTQASASIQLGGSIWDTATVANNPNSGSDWIVFQLFGPGEGCSGLPIWTNTQSTDSSGSTFPSDTFTPSEVGTYHWIANLWGRGEGSVQLTQNGCGEPNESVTVTTTPPPPPPPPATPLMSVVKSNDTTAPVASGTAVHYTLTVSVQNTSAIAGVTIVDQLPAGIGSATAISDGGAYNSSTNRVTWSDLTVANGKQLTYTAVVSATTAPNGLVNTATITQGPCVLTGCTSSSTVDVAAPAAPNNNPGGAVAGATGRPHITPPPTSGLGSVPAQPAGATWWIVLLGLAALGASLLVFIPKSSPERRRR